MQIVFSTERPFGKRTPNYPDQLHEVIVLYLPAFSGLEVWVLTPLVPRLDIFPDGLPIIRRCSGLIVDFLYVLVVRDVSVGMVAIVFLFWHLMIVINSSQMAIGAQSLVVIAALYRE